MASTSGHVDAYGIQPTPPPRSSSMSINICTISISGFHLPTLLCKPRMRLSTAHISMLSNTLVSSGCVRRPQGKVTSPGLKSPHHGPWQKRSCRLHACWGVSWTVSCFLITRASSLLHWNVTGVTMWHGRVVTNTVGTKQFSTKKNPRADTTALEVVYFSHNALLREVKSNRQTDPPRKHVCDG